MILFLKILQYTWDPFRIIKNLQMQYTWDPFRIIKKSSNGPTGFFRILQRILQDPIRSWEDPIGSCTGS